MKRYRYYYQSLLQFEGPVGRHDFCLRCLPCHNACQHIVSEELHILPEASVQQGMDGQKNRIQYGHTLEEHDAFVFTCNGEVELDEYAIPASGPVGIYLPESRLTGIGGRLRRFVRSLSCPHGADRLEQALHVASALQQEMAYRPGATNNQTTATEAFERGEGVCQDYAHIFIAICRQLGIPTRYVNGFVPGTGLTHAWTEVLTEGRCWMGIDPTAGSLVSEGYIKIAHGRDAADCPVNRGIFRGAPTGQRAEVRVIVEQ